MTVYQIYGYHGKQNIVFIRRDGEVRVMPKNWHHRKLWGEAR